MLTELQERIENHSNELAGIIIDNSCMWRNKLEEMIGNVCVELDT